MRINRIYFQQVDDGPLTSALVMVNVEQSESAVCPLIAVAVNVYVGTPLLLAAAEKL